MVELTCRKPKLLATVFDHRSATLQNWEMREKNRDFYPKIAMVY